MVRQIECSDPNAVEFNFRGIGARFDRHTFAVVNGLTYGTLPPIGEMLVLTDRLWNKYFRSIGTINAKDMITKFEKYPFVESEVDDNVSICMFYLLEIVFLSVYNMFTQTANEKKSKHLTAFKYKANEIHYYSPPEVFVEVDAPTNGPHDEPSVGTSHGHDMHRQHADVISKLSTMVQAIMHHLDVGVHCSHYFT
ncbi:hypothetical protein FNV43_RR00103 [Rhamnella rubrinervis]|uniref:Uncharacterized protein n=1 Tax=Rhamnella rubrinervis TaxID=2594499 RepID=A0A8K0HPZ5_9ROSA|nr:hypothetical protein FNV43_RR00103 [Rhamnella rubrinervis]